jgi:hypothetical protein
MPNRTTHLPIAIGCGTIAAFTIAYRQPFPDCLAETIGGALGGWATGMLADRIDPPEHPHHRGLGHALVPNSLAAAAYVPLAREWQQTLRLKAQGYESMAAQAPPGSPQWWYVVLAYCCRLASGALAGAVAGHWSHLILDSHTTCGIPVFLQGY